VIDDQERAILSVPSYIAPEQLANKQAEPSSSLTASEHSPVHSQEHSVERTVARTAGRADSRANIQASMRTDGQALERTAERTERHLNAQSGEHPGSRSDALSSGHPGGHSFGQLILPEFYWMTENWSKVLNFLIANKPKITKLEIISEATGVPYGSVRRAISALIKNKIMTKSNYRAGHYQGLAYTLDEIRIERWQSREHSAEHSRDQTHGRTGGQVAPCSSSSIIKLTTNSGNQDEGDLDWESMLASDMDLRYWRSSTDLRASVVIGWIKKYKIKPLVMLDSLRNADWELRKRERQAEERKALGEENWDRDIVRKPLDWFHSPISTYGCFGKAKDYKSYDDDQIEKEQMILNENRIQQEKQSKLKLERNFQEMLKYPDGEEYQFYYSQLPPFSRKRYNPGDEILTQLLRGVFFSMHGVEIETNRGLTCGA
jgi:hypothetical protein